jgi:hypothetical protein
MLFDQCHELLVQILVTNLAMPGSVSVRTSVRPRQYEGDIAADVPVLVRQPRRERSDDVVIAGCRARPARNSHADPDRLEADRLKGGGFRPGTLD